MTEPPPLHPLLARLLNDPPSLDWSAVRRRCVGLSRRLDTPDGPRVLRRLLRLLLHAEDVRLAELAIKLIRRVRGLG
jgi:hypothetical protein